MFYQWQLYWTNIDLLTICVSLSIHIDSFYELLKWMPRRQTNGTKIISLNSEIITRSRLLFKADIRLFGIVKLKMVLLNLP